jgi:CheY-like chemotaxis protein
MEQSRVIIIEDNQRDLERARLVLEQGHHIVTGTATDLLGALALIDAIRDESIACDVVILDGNLSTDRDSPRDGTDAKAVFDRARRYKLPLKFVGFSMSLMREDYGIPVDADPGKDAVSRLASIVDAL